jgi:MFS family permease
VDRRTDRQADRQIAFPRTTCASLASSTTSATCYSATIHRSLVPARRPRVFVRVHGCPGFIFAGMAVISLICIMPASLAADRLGRKWTIVPSCACLGVSLLLMAVTGVARMCLPACLPASLPASPPRRPAAAHGSHRVWRVSFYLYVCLSARLPSPAVTYWRASTVTR